MQLMRLDVALVETGAATCFVLSFSSETQLFDGIL